MISLPDPTNAVLGAILFVIVAIAIFWDLRPPGGP